ncbi:unnamed protein product [Ectocarpus sp. CCAP 1310/34]|nr:unnamed protein product [Ectocarpus sp. CCAP 1310/34]
MEWQSIPVPYRRYRYLSGRSRPYHWHTATSSTIHNNLCLSRCCRRR